MYFAIFMTDKYDIIRPTAHINSRFDACGLSARDISDGGIA
ncbi:MAG: hypothetical protein ORN98_01930 [Alphaproteobacteria bacterium]|nr:hypothetical protein [Alphaproteobacteria bacterium]